MQFFKKLNSELTCDSASPSCPIPHTPQRKENRCPDQNHDTNVHSSDTDNTPKVEKAKHINRQKEEQQHGRAQWLSYWVELRQRRNSVQPPLYDSIPRSSVSEESAFSAGDPGSIPQSGRSPGGGNGNKASILAWRILWTEGPGGLQSMGPQRVEHNWSACTQAHGRLHLALDTVWGLGEISTMLWGTEAAF